MIRKTKVGQIVIKDKKQGEKGVTLVALVITVVVLALVAEIIVSSRSKDN